MKSHSFLPRSTVQYPHSAPFVGEVARFLVYNWPLLVSELVSTARFLLGEGGGRGSVAVKADRW